VGEKEGVSGVLCAPEKHRVGEGIGVILAHGAGNDMENPLILSLSKGLAEIGFFTLRFNFPYKEKGKKAPDNQAKLTQTWQSAYQFLKAKSGYEPARIVTAGKSMGGRVASQMVAEGLLPSDGLVFLGYPLHAPGKKDKLRDSHLYQINIPMLFFAGTRDPLCDPALLKGVLNGLRCSWELETIEGGNHSFILPKPADRPQQEIHEHIVKKTADWARRVCLEISPSENHSSPS
jgi:predicted alpha/beta-hydrolase family hydrolase